jgi:hypothetical protein
MHTSARAPHCITGRSNCFHSGKRGARSTVEACERTAAARQSHAISALCTEIERARYAIIRERPNNNSMHIPTERRGTRLCR